MKVFKKLFSLATLILILSCKFIIATLCIPLGSIVYGLNRVDRFLNSAIAETVVKLEGK